MCFDVHEVPRGAFGLCFEVHEVPRGAFGLCFEVHEVPRGAFGLCFEVHEVPRGAFGLCFEVHEVWPSRGLIILFTTSGSSRTPRPVGSSGRILIRSFSPLGGGHYKRRGGGIIYIYIYICVCMCVCTIGQTREMNILCCATADVHSFGDAKTQTRPARSGHHSAAWVLSAHGTS